MNKVSFLKELQDSFRAMKLDPGGIEELDTKDLNEGSSFGYHLDSHRVFIEQYFDAGQFCYIVYIVVHHPGNLLNPPDHEMVELFDGCSPYVAIITMAQTISGGRLEEYNQIKDYEQAEIEEKEAEEYWKNRQ